MAEQCMAGSTSLYLAHDLLISPFLNFCKSR